MLSEVFYQGSFKSRGIDVLLWKSVFSSQYFYISCISTSLIRYSVIFEEIKLILKATCGENILKINEKNYTDTN